MNFWEAGSCRTPSIRGDFGYSRYGGGGASEGRSCIQETESKIIAQINASLRNCFGRLNNERIEMKRPGNLISGPLCCLEVLKAIQR